MVMSRSAAAILVPILFLGIVISNHLHPWVPESAHGVNLWRILAVTLGVYLFYLAITTHTPAAARRLGRAKVCCLACDREFELAAWMRRGRCPHCRGGEYEFVGRPAWRNAKYLPGAIKLPTPAPTPAPPTPIARRPSKPRGRLLQPVEMARCRLGIAEQRRVRSRVADVLVERRKVVRV